MHGTFQLIKFVKFILRYFGRRLNQNGEQKQNLITIKVHKFLDYLPSFRIIRKPEKLAFGKWGKTSFACFPLRL